MRGVHELSQVAGPEPTSPKARLRLGAAVASVVVLIMAVMGPVAQVEGAKPKRTPRPTPTPTATPPPANCDLVPQLRDVAITQGVGAYTPLVRGKETLVRAFLSKPACAASSAIIELTGGSVIVTPGSGSPTTISNPTPRPVSPYPQLASASAAPLVNSTADPIWVVPGSALAPSTTAAFTATFQVTVTYQSRASSTATPVPGSVTFTTRPGSSTPITAPVGARTNALRILVVPMGNASLPFAESYTQSGDAVLQAAMLTMSRIYPLPDGIGTLTNGVGGLRYSVTSGLLDLKALLGSDGLFCGTGGSSGNFNAIKALLAQYLQSWNAANGAANQADRVLGVVDAAISKGSSAGCAEGMAAVNSPEAWIRAVPEAQGVPSQSGLVAALEMGHTFGLVLPARDDPFSKYHSPNVYADPTRSGRSYNTRLRSVIVDDRTAMTFIGAANNNNTLLEQLDWAYLICRFGGATSAECPAPAVPIGSGAGVAAGPRFVISGTTDGTVAGTEVVESFFSTDQLPTPPDPQSDLRLVYRNGGGIIADLGVPSYSEDSAHDHDGPGDPNEHADRSLFSGAFDFQTDATRIELWHGAPGSGLLLYARDRNAPPVLDAVTVSGGTGEAENYTNAPEFADIDPAISADGQWIAWAALDLTNEGEQLIMRVAPADDSSNATPLIIGDVEVNSSDPAWCADGTQLAFVNDEGDLYRIDVDTSDGVNFGTPVLLYDSDGFYTPFARDPTWSPDCSQLAYELDGDIWRIDADGTNAVALTDNGSSFDPSWSPDPEDNRIAYVEEPATFFFTEGSKLGSLLPPAIALASFVEPDAPRSAPADHGGNHFVVNSADDVSDGTCDATHCSLREAILAANGSGNLTAPDEIDFNIAPGGVQTIAATSALPAITDPVIIDGTTQPGYDAAPVIELDGTNAGDGVDGLVMGIGGDSVTVRGLAVNAFSRDGIRIFADDNVVEGNYIGIGLDGTTDRGNVGIGVQVLGGSGTRIGTGVDVGSGNVISGNDWHGISISGGTALDPVLDTIIGGNLIGTDVAGTAAVGNTGFGVFFGSFAQFSQLGGLTAGQRNVISANGFGVVIGIGAASNTLQGNYIGTDITGAVDLGNISNGIEINQGSGTMIGGHVVGAGNVISGNGTTVVGANGIRIVGNQAIGNQMYRNRIGTDVTGTLALGNSSDGVEIDFDSSQNRIGSAVVADQNTIAHNGGAGILVPGGTGNTIRGNAVHDNGGLGIDIGPEGVTPNDEDDVDTGANDLENFPIITSAHYDGSSVTVNGTINSVPNSGQTIDIYVSDDCDGSGNGEGALWLVQRFVTVDASGDGTFSATGLNGIVPGQVITATAGEGESNSSSEFSPCVTVTGGSPEDPSFVVNTTDDSDDGLCGTLHCSLREAIDRANAVTGTDTITFDIAPGGAQTITVTTALPQITEAVVIDGQTQPGAGGDPIVRIDGGGTVANGFVVSSVGGSTLRGLIVTGFAGDGLQLAGQSGTVESSWVGVDGAGEEAGNGGWGVRISGDDNTVSESVISGNTAGGISIAVDDGSAFDNVVRGSIIGLNPNADTAVPNGTGIDIDSFGAGGTQIGGTNEGDPNLISGNVGDGIFVGQTNNHTILGNYIGTDESGNAAIPNGGSGIYINGGGEIYVGDGTAGGRNLISGNAADGIYVASDQSDIQILGNFIGIDDNGSHALGNGGSGIHVDGARDALIGDGTFEGRNLIGGNAVGIMINDTDGSSSVQGNYIGTDIEGTDAVPNGVGIILDSAQNEVIGGPFEGDGNVISGNTGDGIAIFGDPEGEAYASFNEIAGNLIGTDVSGAADLGNGGDGIDLSIVTDDNVIGGDTTETPGVGNIISGNGGNGVNIGISFGNVIQGNLIGTDASGTVAIGNDLAGVRITGPSQMNQVGASHSGTSISGPGNTIANNGGNGVELVGSGIEPMTFDADLTSILSNSIHDNGGLGIDLEADGVTPNDPLDADDGSNDLKNFPDVVSGTSDGFTTVGTIGSDNSAPSEIIVYQLFANDDCDPSGNGEGQRLVATVETAADETGTARANFFVEEDLSGLWLTATTADNQGQTSEFSVCTPVDFDDGGSDGEIRLLNASVPLEPTELLVAEGDDPFWSLDGILYSVAGGVRRIQPDGSGDEAITEEGTGDQQPTAGLGVIGFVHAADSDEEIFLIRAGGQVTVSATDEAPADLRLDLYYACGGEILPIAVGITPDQTGTTTATFKVNFDASLSCAGGEILAALTDGFQRAVTPPGSGDPVESEDKPPVAATYGPPLGDTYLMSAVIPFHGTGEDAEDGTLTGASLTWFIRPASAGCCGTQAGTGTSVDYDASQLAPGDYIVTLVATDSQGHTDSAESLIHILADSDNDGFSDTDESSTCFGAGAATDGSTPSGDADGDGIPNGSDSEPCVAQPAVSAIVEFDPDQLNLKSKGQTIAATIKIPGQDLSLIDPASVRIVAIAGETVAIDAVSWTVKKGMARAKFSRPALVAFLTARGIQNERILITVAGTSTTNPPWRFEAVRSMYVKR
jgi:CSLREA domain-containing protein